MFHHLVKNGFRKVGLKTHKDNLQARNFYEYCGGQYAGQIKTDWDEVIYTWSNLDLLIEKNG